MAVGPLLLLQRDDRGHHHPAVRLAPGAGAVRQTPGRYPPQRQLTRPPGIHHVPPRLNLPLQIHSPPMSLISHLTGYRKAELPANSGTLLCDVFTRSFTPFSHYDRAHTCYPLIFLVLHYRPCIHYLFYVINPVNLNCLPNFVLLSHRFAFRHHTPRSYLILLLSYT